MNRRRVHPVVGPLDATVTVPGSKSIANRALVCAALADGDSVVRGLPDGDDTAAMLEGLGALGVTIAESGGVARVQGSAGRVAAGPSTVRTRLAGTTSRFLTAVASLGPGPSLIDGDEPLRRRPMGDLHEALVALGATVEALGAVGHLPVSVRCGTLHRSAGPAHLVLRGDVSSQFLTAVMLVGPYLPGGLDVELSTHLVSRPYVAMTASVMAAFGHDDVVIEERRVRVGPGRYAARDYQVEPDASSASYALGAAAIVGGRVRVRGLGPHSLQGDARFADVLAAMGCTVRRGEHWTEVERTGALQGVTVNLADISDCAPTFAAVAAVAQTPSVATGIGFIRAKESDRIGDVVAGLTALGVDAGADADGFTVRPSALHGGVIATHHDHRLAMAFALLGLVTSGVEIEDPDVVSKSFPGFWAHLDELSASAPPAR